VTRGFGSTSPVSELWKSRPSLDFDAALQRGHKPWQRGVPRRQIRTASPPFPLAGLTPEVPLADPGDDGTA